MKILFVCNFNCTRSKMFEKMFKYYFPQEQVLSAGLIDGNPYIVDEAILNWANRVYVMTLAMKKEIEETFNFGKYNKIKVIGVSNDTFDNSQELMDLARYWLSKREWMIE